MKQNMGSIDRVIRICITLAIAILYFTVQITSTAVIILGLLAVIFLLTSVIGFCPLYVPLKLTTKQDPKTTA